MDEEDPDVVPLQQNFEHTSARAIRDNYLGFTVKLYPETRLSRVNMAARGMVRVTGEAR
jgi:hypothetical protein